MNRTVMLANLPIKTLILHTTLPSGDRYLEAGVQEIKGKVGQEPENVQNKNLIRMSRYIFLKKNSNMNAIKEF